jgi:hypothetical protein
MEKEKQAYFSFINSLGDELDEAGEDFQNELGYESAYPFFYGYHSRDEEINALKAEIEELRKQIDIARAEERAKCIKAVSNHPWKRFNSRVAEVQDAVERIKALQDKEE